MPKDVWIRVKQDGAECLYLPIEDIKSLSVFYEENYNNYYVIARTQDYSHTLVTGDLDKCHRIANKLTDMLNIVILDL